MTTRDEILVKIKDIICLFDSPLDPSEIKNGWTPALQKKWKNYYQQVLEYIKSGKSLSKKPEYTASIVRAYDFSGIMKGELLDKAIDIQCRLRELEKGEGG